MDFKSFCVENRGKLRPSHFPFFASFSQRGKMSKSYDLTGMSVGEAILEENCFTAVHTLDSNMKLIDTGEGSYTQKNQSIGQYDKFSISISKLVGGFVGSKSQGGSASREPCQVWDVILRQLVNSAHQSVVQSHCCINDIESAVPPKIFETLYRRGNPTFDFASYFLNSCDFLHNKGMGENMCNTKQMINSSPSKARNFGERQCVSEITPTRLQSEEQTKAALTSSRILKQTYADVAKSFTVMKLGEGSSQRQQILASTKCAVPRKNPKDSRQTRQYIRNHCVFDKSQMKSMGKAPKPDKYKNAKQKEKRNINNCVQQDHSFLCGLPEEVCKNWRCPHTRTQKLPFAAEKWNRTPNTGKNTRAGFHMPNMSMQMPQDIKIEDKCRVDDNLSQGRVDKSHDKVDKGICEETPTSCVILEVINNHCVSLNTPEDCLRPRVLSECSVESEDSFVVFDSGECETNQTFSCGDASDESDSENECDQHVSDIESSDDGDGMGDEVDFCRVDSSEYLIDFHHDVKCDDPYAYMSDQLQDVNAKWKKENSDIPSGERVSKKVHFATGSRLAKVHPMVKWEFAHRQARQGPWEELARDRCRFSARIERIAVVLTPILQPEHRRKIQERVQHWSCIKVDEG